MIPSLTSTIQMLEYARSSGKSLTYVGIGMFAFPWP